MVFKWNEIPSGDADFLAYSKSLELENVAANGGGGVGESEAGARSRGGTGGVGGEG